MLKLQSIVNLSDSPTQSPPVATGPCSGGASKEIAKSLHMLFGGIDLDPTDRLLGVLLVSKEQHRRRRCQAVHVLRAAGAPALGWCTARGDRARLCGMPTEQ